MSLIVSITGTYAGRGRKWPEVSHTYEFPVANYNDTPPKTINQIHNSLSSNRKLKDLEKLEFVYKYHDENHNPRVLPTFSLEKN